MPAKREGSTTWSWDKRVQVVTTYLALGNASMVEAVTKVPAGTVRQWRTQDWWKDLEGQLMEERALELNGKLKRIVDKSLDMVMDRLDNGDISYNPKTGEFTRRPAYLKDLNKTLGDALDKQVLLQKFQKPAEAKQDITNQLKELAREFAAIVKGQDNVTNNLSGDSLSRDAEREQKNENLSNMPTEISSEDGESEVVFCNLQDEK